MPPVTPNVQCSSPRPENAIGRAPSPKRVTALALLRTSRKPRCQRPENEQTHATELPWVGEWLAGRPLPGPVSEPIRAQKAESGRPAVHRGVAKLAKGGF